ncbi:unnamed protein product [Urochloa decumbens]|uniref:Uncharacterized protein n=1 Tax=Urochloa decumbens TaxID=240449 RepID=A0ABC9H174_9POAL
MEMEEEGHGFVPRFRHAALVGLATMSLAIDIALAMSDDDLPPAGLHSRGAFYSIALTGAFLAGTAGLLAAVWVSNNPCCASCARRRAVGRNLVCASIGSLAIVVGLFVASLPR